MAKVDSKRQIVFNKFNGHCAYCGCDITIKNFQVDHILAKYRGGSDDVSNLFPACIRCNRGKETFTIDEFRTQIMKKLDTVRKISSQFRHLERFGIIKQVKTKVTFYFEQFPKDGNNES